MTARQIRAAAVTVWLLSMALLVADLGFIVAGGAGADEGGRAGAAIWSLSIAGAPVVGAVIATRRPDNRYGWLLLSFGVLSLASDAAGHYARWAHATGRSGVLEGAVVESLLWPSLPFHLPLLLLFFPDGRVPSPRWRWLWRVVVVCGVAAVGFGFFLPIDLGVAGLSNPYGARGVWGTVTQAVVFGAVMTMFASVIAAAASMVARWRRATGHERLQLRWFAWAAGLMAAVLAGTGAGAFISNEVLNSLIFAAAMASLFGAIGVAVLRYRLYEIDRIISRTVTYAAVTVVVVAVYLAAVTLVTRITAPVTGDSPIAVAAATLAAAAVFGPARRRIQTVVDRQFNRGRYDAVRTAESYRTRLREELDLDAITADLVGTAQTAVQPRAATLWIRDTR